MLLMLSESPGSVTASVNTLQYFPHAVPNLILLPLYDGHQSWPTRRSTLFQISSRLGSCWRGWPDSLCLVRSFSVCLYPSTLFTSHNKLKPRVDGLQWLFHLLGDHHLPALGAGSPQPRAATKMAGEQERLWWSFKGYACNPVLPVVSAVTQTHTLKLLVSETNQRLQDERKYLSYS